MTIVSLRGDPYRIENVRVRNLGYSCNDGTSGTVDLRFRSDTLSPGGNVSFFSGKGGLRPDDQLDFFAGLSKSGDEIRGEVFLGSEYGQEGYICATNLRTNGDARPTKFLAAGQ